jgi:hypothetical protein
MGLVSVRAHPSVVKPAGYWMDRQGRNESSYRARSAPEDVPMSNVIPMPSRCSALNDQREALLECRRQLEMSQAAIEIALAIVRIVKKDQEWEIHDMDRQQFAPFRKLGEYCVQELNK